ncbi:hypothetical protein SSPS47_04000 [Streptomyces sp. S4.7]|uniref:erythromycin esterase family protein n=1 Tax=Streptomyces sp. S4.7 TaxID=2705439 RepID=UPI0013991DEC|nr:erythromycin esterase family protein [Streptomyces sp. S4.7]QHY94289.1 hypothetical protein SSPS47_04000 [Streptomyces sp. S4.7]
MTETMPQWIGRHTHRLTTLDPGAPLTDLLPLVDIVRDARVVAVGASTRQAHELSTLSHRVVRLLVEDLGFRSLALEGDDASRVGLDEYIGGGTGDPRALLAEARSLMLDEVRDQAALVSTVAWAADPSWDREAGEHREILRLALAGDSAGAALALHDHIASFVRRAFPEGDQI